MPKLVNEKREKFATYIANGYRQMAAYKEAGYACKNTTAAANASKLLSDPEVAARVEELKIKAEQASQNSIAPPLPMKKEPSSDIDLDWINREYLAFLTIAKDGKDLKNAAILLKDLAELNKIRPEKTEEETKNRMLPSNDKSHMGNQTYVQIINQKSEKNGGGIDGLVAINLPDDEPVFVSNNAINED